MSLDIKLGHDTYRVSYVVDGRFGCFSPELWIGRTGPNGSIAGTGPKGFPPVFGIFRPYYEKRQPSYQRNRWIGTLHVPIPHLTFHRAFKLRRIGGLRAYRVNSWLMYALHRDKRRFVWPWK